MSPTARALAAAIAALFLPGLVLAQEGSPNEWDEEYAQAPSDAAPPDTQAQPPPAPPGSEQAQAPAPQGVPDGQWVQTDQYGWVWMPYGDAYTAVPADGYGEPTMYVYAPAYGWCWLGAPWVWGYGPWPHFGVGVVVNFGWYGHGWWRTPGHWHYAPGHYSHGGWRDGGGHGSGSGRGGFGRH